MFSSDLSADKIYARLLYQLDDIKVFPKNFFEKKNILYEYRKNNPNKTFVVVNIVNTVHYKYVNNVEGSLQNYSSYIKIADQKNHSIDKFNTLISQFNIDRLKDNPIKLKKIKYGMKNYYIINDGIHRLSILFNKKDKLLSSYYEIQNN